MEPQNIITPSDDRTASPEVNPNLVQQPAAQVITPTGYNPATTVSEVNNKPDGSAQETTILCDTGYLQNLFQKSVAAKRLTLTLYTNHLKIEDADTGEVLEDTPISQIVKTTRYFSSRLLYLLYTSLIGSRFLLIKTANKRYKISWVNSDKQSMLYGGGGAAGGLAGGDIIAQENFSKTMQWVKAIKDLQANTLSSTSQSTSYQSTATPKKQGKRWLKVLVGLIAVFLILCVLYVFWLNISTQSTVKVSNQFVADIQTDNVRDAWALTSPAFQKTTSEASFTQAISAISPGLQGTATIPSNGKNLIGSQAMVVYTISTSSGNKYIKIALKNNKPWQVTAYTTSDTALNAHTQLDGYY